MEMDDRLKLRTETQSRVAIVINTYYPEIQGGHYFNRRILKVVQECLSKLDCHAVLRDIYSPANALPVEPPGSLELKEDYYLVDKQRKIKGALILWNFSTGGGGDFCQDDVVMDFLIETDQVPDIKMAIKDECHRQSIRFEDRLFRRA